MPDPATTADMPPLDQHMEFISQLQHRNSTRFDRVKKVRKVMENVHEQYVAGHSTLDWVLLPETVVVQKYAEALVDLIEDEAVRMVKGEG